MGVGTGNVSGGAIPRDPDMERFWGFVELAGDEKLFVELRKERGKYEKARDEANAAIAMVGKARDIETAHRKALADREEASRVLASGKEAISKLQRNAGESIDKRNAVLTERENVFYKRMVEDEKRLKAEKDSLARRTGDVETGEEALKKAREEVVRLKMELDVGKKELAEKLKMIRETGAAVAQ